MRFVRTESGDKVHIVDWETSLSLTLCGYPPKLSWRAAANRWMPVYTNGPATCKKCLRAAGVEGV